MIPLHYRYTGNWRQAPGNVCGVEATRTGDMPAYSIRALNQQRPAGPGGGKRPRDVD